MEGLVVPRIERMVRWGVERKGVEFIFVWGVEKGGMCERIAVRILNAH